MSGKRPQAYDFPRLSAELARFARELFRWNARVNLFSRSMTPHDVEEALLESWELSALLPREGLWAEVGAGGGLMAIPFALARRDLPAVLLEPRMRRRAFLLHIRRLLHLEQVEVLEHTVEAWDPPERPVQIWVRALPRGPFRHLLRRRRGILAEDGVILHVRRSPEGFEDADNVIRHGPFWIGVYGR